jgi:hypothetical protein
MLTICWSFLALTHFTAAGRFEMVCDGGALDSLEVNLEFVRWFDFSAAHR